MSRTIGGVSTVVYDASAFAGNPTFLGQNKTLFRTKGSMYNTGFNNTIFADVSPPFWIAFDVGASGSPFPVANRDYQFRPVFYAPPIGGTDNAAKPRIERIYNYFENLTAHRVA